MFVRLARHSREDLLKARLAHGVILDKHLVLLINVVKQLANSFAFSRNSELEEVAALFDKVNLRVELK